MRKMNRKRIGENRNQEDGIGIGYETESRTESESEHEEASHSTTNHDCYCFPDHHISSDEEIDDFYNTTVMIQYFSQEDNIIFNQNDLVRVIYRTPTYSIVENTDKKVGRIPTYCLNVSTNQKRNAENSDNFTSYPINFNDEEALQTELNHWSSFYRKNPVSTTYSDETFTDEYLGDNQEGFKFDDY